MKNNNKTITIVITEDFVREVAKTLGYSKISVSKHWRFISQNIMSTLKHAVYNDILITIENVLINSL